MYNSAFSVQGLGCGLWVRADSCVGFKLSGPNVPDSFFLWGGGLSDEGLGFVWVSAWGLIRTNEKLTKRALQNMSLSCTLHVLGLNTSAGIKFYRAYLYLYAEDAEYRQVHFAGPG